MNNIRYTFVNSKSGELIPAFINEEGNTQALHSTVDPKREAERLITSISEEIGFIVFLGLGGGFAPMAALELTNAFVAVIDYDGGSIKELFKSKDYSKLLNSERFKLLIDPCNEEIKNFILENFKPALHGGIKTIPLRARTEHDKEKFEDAASGLQEAINAVSGDYSVQAHFGVKWFINILRNVKNARIFDAQKYNVLGEGFTEAAIVAAGPSLDSQIELLQKAKTRKVFIISTDTACGVLLQNGIAPDVVVSIDCQHISYYHFIGNKPQNIPLVLDIASPPLLSGFSASPLFFSSGHPLALYISKHWRNFPLLDTSGGNVTYACLSLAEFIGFKRVTLFGADFSYVGSQSYARGTYLYPYFYKRQSRFTPVEAQSSAFLYRAPFIPAEDGNKKNYYETSSLRFYRKKLEEKARGMEAEIIRAPGSGAQISLQNFNHEPHQPHEPTQIKREEIKEKRNQQSSEEFLIQYKEDIAALPAADGANYLNKLNEKERQVFTTLLPLAAAIKKRNATLKFHEIIEEVKNFSVKEIEKVLE